MTALEKSQTLQHQSILKFRVEDIKEQSGISVSQKFRSCWVKFILNLFRFA
jgi:hypothetical protein